MADSNPVPGDAGARHDSAPNKFLLQLYVAGRTPRTELAVANLNALCEDELAGRYQLEIIDVLEHPERAEEAKILATPTLIKQLPPPLRRIIGDLSNRERVLLGLQVRSSADNPVSDREAP
ncbi:MAG TPA: circadian clock KaiB family protein [Gemmatimonadaceae bacterium]|nr:circadian clock KaiB family protein [Gemmatimonadaceae bacterium]